MPVIVISMLLVILAFVSLVLGVLDVTIGEVEPLTFVYGAIGLCLLAGLFLAIGVLRSRPKPLVTADGQGASWSGAARRRDGARPDAPGAPAQQAPAEQAGPPAEGAPAEQAGPPAEGAPEPPVAPAPEPEPPVAPEPEPPVALEPEPRLGRFTLSPPPEPSAEPAPPPTPAAEEPPTRPPPDTPATRPPAPPRAPEPDAPPALSAEKVAQRLAAVSGVGPARQRTLLEHFGSHEAVARASVEELAAVRGVSETLARRIHEGLRR